MNLVKLAYQKGYRITPDGLTVTGPKGHPLKLRIDAWGYPIFNLKAERNVQPCRIHRLQAYQKFGEFIFIPGVQVRHLDCNQRNNHHANLALGNQSQNMMDRPASARRKLASHPQYDHEAAIAHYEAHGWRSTLLRFGMCKSALSWMLRKSMAAERLHRRPQEAAA